jgi:uncharacterized protein (TIGR03663 family)
MAQTTVDSHAPQPAAQAESGPAPLDWTINLSRVSWEAVAWLATAPLALALRLVWLDGWPLRGQEAAVAGTAWALLNRGEVAGPVPVEAGPAVTLLTSFLVFLFGAGDATVRLGAALAGAGLVAACWWLRPYIGRAGALVAAQLLTWSPLALYSSRQLTPEAFAACFLLLLALCLLRLRSGGGRPALLVAAAAFTLAIFSHYLALPVALLLIALAPLAARWATGPAEPATAPRSRRRDGADATPASPRPAGAGELAAPRLGQADWLMAAAVGVGMTVVIALLASTGGLDLLANLFSPLTAWGALAPPAERAPLFLPLLLLVYEPLTLAGALASAWTVGSSRETAPQRLTGLLLVFWATGALLLAALAGDRDPAQALYPLLPLALLAGRVIGDLLLSIPWDRYRRERGPVLSGVSALALIAGSVFAATLTGGSGGATVPANYAVTLLLDFILSVALVAATIYLMRPLGYRAGGQIVLLTALGFLALYGIRSATQLAYVQPASAVELAVQEQPAPGLTSVVERLDRLSRDLTGMRRSTTDVTGGHGLEIALDRAVALPFDWYLRAFTQRTTFDPAGGLPGNPAVVIVASGGEAALRQTLDRGYVGQRYPFVWSFPAGGIGGGARGLVRYLLYREPATPPVATEFSVYLRRDLADRVLFKGVAGADAAAAQPPANLFDRAGRGRAPGQFDSPRGIAVDDQGNIYVVDTVNARVQKFDPQGNHLWSVGSTGSGPGQFARVQNGPGPTGIAVDRQGFIYVADTWNHRIVKLDPQGKFLKSWGGFFNTQGNPDVGRQHPSEFYGPRSIAIGPDNTLYVTDTGNKRVLVFDSNGTPLRQFGSAGSGPANLNEPVGIAIDDAGVLYIADTHNSRVATFDTQGRPLAQWPVPTWSSTSYQEPYIAVAGDTVYVANGPGRNVLLFDKQGKPLGEERRVDNLELINPTGIAVAPDGAVYVVDTGAHAVLRLR